MSWAGVGESIDAYFVFIASKLGKTGLAPDVYVTRNGSVIVNGSVAADEVSQTSMPGLYRYTLSGASVTAVGEYVFRARTSDTTVDVRDVFALWTVGRSGVNESIPTSVEETLSPTLTAILRAGTLGGHDGVLRFATPTICVFGPFISSSTGATLAGMSLPAVTGIAADGGATAVVLTDWTDKGNGYYTATVPAQTVFGRLRLIFAASATYVPFYQDYDVIPAEEVYDPLYAGGVNLMVDLTPLAEQAAGFQAMTQILKTDWNTINGEATFSVLNALRFLRNKRTISGTTLTVYEENGTTPAYTLTLTTDSSALPIVGSSP